MRPEVDTASGRLAGSADGDIAVFKGIPYAAPPIGPLRLRHPAPPPSWSGTRDALTFGPIAPQKRGLLDQFLGSSDQPTSEDCLTLNVWTPACDDRGRSVLVWIHGGAFTTGCGSAAWFDGAAMARNGDVVVVTLNYRLGALGFTALDGLDPAFAAAGNLGLLDQLAALTWVRENISRFGGSADDVTIFGESAGGASAVALLAMPASEGLFHRAIVQSASFTQLRSRETATRSARRMLTELGLADEPPARMAEVPVDDILAAQQRIQAETTSWFTAFSPVADGDVLPATVDAVLAAAAARDVPVLVGTTRDEMHLFTAFDPVVATLDEAGLHSRAAEVLGEATPAALAAYRAARPGATPGQLASAIATDHGFRWPALRLAEARVAAGTPTWMYLFAWPSPAFGGLLGACHGIELPFVFHNLTQPGVAVLTGDGPERVTLADQVQAAWLAFAARGEPGWAPYDIALRATMRFDTKSAVVDDPEGDLREVWTGTT